MLIAICIKKSHTDPKARCLSVTSALRRLRRRNEASLGYTANPRPTAELLIFGLKLSLLSAELTHCMETVLEIEFFTYTLPLVSALWF